MTEPPELGVFDDVAPVGFAVATTEGVVTGVNAAFARITGQDRDELLRGRHISDLLSAGSRIFWETHVRPQLVVEGAIRQVALDLRQPAGGRRAVLLSAVLDRGPDGTGGALRLAVYEAEERRAYERELLAATRRAEAAAASARELARTLQRSLMPARPPSIEGLELAAAYHPAGDGTQVGGDFYDAFPLSATTWVVLIGDVCGKGAAAAALTALARHTLRAAFVGNSDPDAALRLLDDVLRQQEDPRFCSLSIVVLHRLEDGWRAVHSTGGHALPLLRRRDGTIGTAGAPGSLVGAIEDPTFSRSDFTLGPGDTLLMFTDGVSEGRGPAGFFGEDRVLRCLVGGGSAVGLVQRLMDRVLAFQEGTARDDIAIVGMRA